MIPLRLTSRRLAKKVTQAIGLRWGERFPFYYVSEYPKSGGTWLGHMLGDYLQVPFPRFSIFPIGCEAVILNHWRYDRRYRRVVYLYRDGRDVMTSFFFHRLRIARQPSSPAHHRVKRSLHSLFGNGYEERETGELLAAFIEHEFRHPDLGSRVNWAEHVLRWHSPEAQRHVSYVSYEGLLADAESELARVVAEVTGQPADEERVSRSVAKYSMRSQTGRKPGQEDADSHVRKGIAGDWRNHFNRHCAEIFDRHGGEALITLGYESDAGWVARAFPGEGAG